MRYSAQAEFRRIHRGAPWRLVGVTIGERFVPMERGIRAATFRQIEAELIARGPLPPIIAPDDRIAAAIALDMASALIEGVHRVPTRDAPVRGIARRRARSGTT